MIPIRLGAVATLVAVALTAACERTTGENVPPQTLAELELHHEVSGARATRAFRRLPGAGREEVRSAWIAGYGSDSQRAMVYAARVRDVAHAAELVRSLRAGLLDRTVGYRKLSPLRKRGYEVLRLSGQGDRHLLFRLGDRVIWLAADPDVAGRALRDLIDHFD